jgi:hypothetical protein
MAREVLAKTVHSEGLAFGRACRCWNDHVVRAGFAALTTR